MRIKGTVGVMTPEFRNERPHFQKAFAGCLGVLAMAVFLAAGCKSKPRWNENNLPLPPGADSGLYDGQFVQTDYGFGFPLPPKWLYVRLSAEQEVDEVARFSDPDHEIIVRISVQVVGDAQNFSKKGWEDLSQQDLENHQFKIRKKESVQEWKTADSEPWVEVPYLVTDTRGDEWADEEWALNKGDILIGAHVLMPGDTVGTDKGKKFLKALEGALTQIHWYQPIGSRGISIDRFELQHFTEDFCKVLESRSASKVGTYFDDMYPDRSKWNDWYQKAVAGDPGSIVLKASLSGLVINGDDATASFTLIRQDKNDSHPQKFDRSFKLSKKEGSWKIMYSMDKN